MNTPMYEIIISPYVQHSLGLSLINNLLNRHHHGDYGVNGDYESNCIQLIDAISNDDDDFSLPGIRNVIALQHLDSDDPEYRFYDSVFSSYMINCEEVWILTNLKLKYTLVAWANCI